MPRPASLPESSALDRFHVVLVEPGDSFNVGAVARAMTNLGFCHLHLVAPPRYDPERAAVAACWAEELLHQALIHPSLEEAIAPLGHVVGFSARHGQARPRHLLLGQWTDWVAVQPPVSTALVFGPEDDGLRREHLPYCHWLVRIPSTEANPSYNLAQAVLLVLYEISRQGWGHIPPAPQLRPSGRELGQLDRLVREVLLRTRFYHKGTPETIPDLVRHLFRRIDADTHELRVLTGLFGKINRVLKGKVPVRRLESDGEDG